MWQLTLILYCGQRRKDEESCQFGILITDGCCDMLTIVSFSLSLRKTKTQFFEETNEMDKPQIKLYIHEFENLGKIEIFLKTITKVDLRRN